MSNLKPLSDIQILIVDDTPLVITMLSAILNALGFSHIASANNGESALEKFRSLEKSRFDVVFLDRYLGDESGIDVLKEIRVRNKELPIIMVTQENEGSKVIEAITAGASDYIVKPFNEEIIVKKLEKVLGRPVK